MLEELEGPEAGSRHPKHGPLQACDWNASLSSELLQEIASRAGVSSWGDLRCVCKSWRRGISLAVQTVRLTVPDRSTAFTARYLPGALEADAQRAPRKGCGAGRPTGRTPAPQATHPAQQPSAGQIHAACHAALPCERPGSGAAAAPDASPSVGLRGDEDSGQQLQDTRTPLPPQPLQLQPPPQPAQPQLTTPAPQPLHQQKQHQHQHQQQPPANRVQSVQAPAPSNGLQPLQSLQHITAAAATASATRGNRLNTASTAAAAAASVAAAAPAAVPQATRSDLFADEKQSPVQLSQPPLPPHPLQGPPQPEPQTHTQIPTPSTAPAHVLGPDTAQLRPPQPQQQRALDGAPALARVFDCATAALYQPSVAIMAAAAAAATAAAATASKPGPQAAPHDAPCDSHAAGMASSVGSSSIVVWNFLEAADKLAAAYPSFVDLSLSFAEPLPLTAAGGSEGGSSRWLQLEMSAALQRLLCDRLVSLRLSGHTPYPLILAQPPNLPCAPCPLLMAPPPSPPPPSPQPIPFKFQPQAQLHDQLQLQLSAAHAPEPRSLLLRHQQQQQHHHHRLFRASRSGLALPTSAEVECDGTSGSPRPKRGLHMQVETTLLPPCPQQPQPQHVQPPSQHHHQHHSQTHLQQPQHNLNVAWEPPPKPQSEPQPPPQSVSPSANPPQAHPPSARSPPDRKRQSHSGVLPDSMRDLAIHGDCRGRSDGSGGGDGVLTVADVVEMLARGEATGAEEQSLVANHSSSPDSADGGGKADRHRRWRGPSEMPSSSAAGGTHPGKSPTAPTVPTVPTALTAASQQALSLRAQLIPTEPANAAAAAAVAAGNGQRGSSGSAPSHGSPGGAQLHSSPGSAPSRGSPVHAPSRGSPGAPRACGGEEPGRRQQAEHSGGCNRSLSCIEQMRVGAPAAVADARAAVLARLQSTAVCGSGDGGFSGREGVRAHCGMGGAGRGGHGNVLVADGEPGGTTAMDVDEAPAVALAVLIEANGSGGNSDLGGLGSAESEGPGERPARGWVDTSTREEDLQALLPRLHPHQHGCGHAPTHQQYAQPPHGVAGVAIRGTAYGNGGGGSGGDASGGSISRGVAADPMGGGDSSNGPGSQVRGPAGGSGSGYRPHGDVRDGSNGHGTVNVVTAERSVLTTSGGHAYSRNQTSSGMKDREADLVGEAAAAAAAVSGQPSLFKPAANQVMTAACGPGAIAGQAASAVAVAAAAAAAAAARGGNLFSGISLTNATTTEAAGVGAGAAGRYDVARAAVAAACGGQLPRCPALLSRLSHLRSLTLVADLGFPSPQHLEAITALQELQELDMRGAKFMQIDGEPSLLGRHAWVHLDGLHVAVLARCTSLTSLSINHVHSVDGLQLMALTALTRLNTLRLTDALSGNVVYGTHVQALAEALTGLKSLDIGRVTCPSFSFLQPPPAGSDLPPAVAAATPFAAGRFGAAAPSSLPFAPPGQSAGAAATVAANAAATAAREVQPRLIAATCCPAAAIACPAAQAAFAGVEAAGVGAADGSGGSGAELKAPSASGAGGGGAGSGAGITATVPAGAAAVAAVAESAEWPSGVPWGPVLGCFQGLVSLHLQVACSFEIELLYGVATLPLLETLSLELLDVPPPQLAVMLQVLAGPAAAGNAGNSDPWALEGGGNGGAGYSTGTGSPVPHGHGHGRRRGTRGRGRGGDGGGAPGAAATAAAAATTAAASSGHHGLRHVFRGLTLTACMLYDEHLVLMGRLNHLQAIRLDQVDIRTRDPDGWTALSALRRLRSFHFHEWNNPVLSAGNLCVLTNDSLAMMAANWPRLQQLSYYGKVALTEKAEENLAKMTSLTSAEITGTEGTSCHVWRSPTTGQLLRTIKLPYTTAKVSSRNGYVTYSDSDDSAKSDGSEASVNWMGEVGYVTSEYDAD